jgi:hypothetical protein
VQKHVFCLARGKASTARAKFLSLCMYYPGRLCNDSCFLVFFRAHEIFSCQDMPLVVKATQSHNYGLQRIVDLSSSTLCFPDDSLCPGVTHRRRRVGLVMGIALATDDPLFPQFARANITLNKQRAMNSDNKRPAPFPRYAEALQGHHQPGTNSTVLYEAYQHHLIPDLTPFHPVDPPGCESSTSSGFLAAPWTSSDLDSSLSRGVATLSQPSIVPPAPFAHPLPPQHPTVPASFAATSLCYHPPTYESAYLPPQPHHHPPHHPPPSLSRNRTWVSAPSFETDATHAWPSLRKQFSADDWNRRPNRATAGRTTDWASAVVGQPMPIEETTAVPIAIKRPVPRMNLHSPSPTVIEAPIDSSPPPSSSLYRDAATLTPQAELFPSAPSAAMPQPSSPNPRDAMVIATSPNDMNGEGQDLQTEHQSLSADVADSLKRLAASLPRPGVLPAPAEAGNLIASLAEVGAGLRFQQRDYHNHKQYPSSSPDFPAEFSKVLSSSLRHGMRGPTSDIGP